MATTKIRDRADQLARLRLQYVGPGPAANTIWAYDESGRAVVVDKDGVEIGPTAPGIKGRTVARAAEIIKATRTAGHVISYTTGNQPAGIRSPLPEHLHACRDKHGRLSDNLGDEIHPDGQCTTWVPFNPAAPVSVDHVRATPERPLAVIRTPVAPCVSEPITATYPGTCGICWGTYRAGEPIVLAHRLAFGSVHTACAERADHNATPLPAYYVHAATK